MPDLVNIQAPAKLNLALAVGPPGDGGMHPICSWMVTVGLYDDLEVRRLPADRFSRYAILWHEDARQKSDIDWSVSRDLAVQAHLALEERAGRKLPVQMKLEKRIPVGGGLGGGSADAAAMLLAVNELYELGLTADVLEQIAHALGSDVPFLVHGGSALVEGLGDRLTRHEMMPELHAVLVFPDAACPTGRVYRQYDEIGPRALQEEAVHALIDAMPRPPRPEGLFNDLAAAAVSVAPRLADDLARLAELAERPAHVSGSGSSIFVLCDDPLHAEFLADIVQREQELPAVAVQAVAGHAQRSGIAGR